MPNFPRLILPTPLAKEQAATVSYLRNSEGLCCCGRFLKKTDAKFCLGQINSSDFPVPSGRNLLIVAVYCYDCFTIINNTLKSLKDKLATPEPDKRRHEGTS